MRTKLTRGSAAVFAILALIFAAPLTAQANQSAAAVSSSVATAGSDDAARVIVWSPYDGSRITSAAGCESRMNYLRSVRPDITHWDCWEYETATCPPRPYWVVMVGTNGARVATSPESEPADAAEPSAARC
jgi:hypothetical protein